MGTVLVVDGSDICRAPIVEFSLTTGFASSRELAGVEVRSRGTVAEAGRTMCENAATRLGFSGPAIAFFGAHRAASLTVADIAAADLILTAERALRSAVVRMLPGTQAMVFTWKEALLLASVSLDRRATGALTAPSDLAGLARMLHGARGTVPLIEPPVRTGPFHWRRAAQSDPLSIESGHAGPAAHGTVTQETVDVAGALSLRLAGLMEHRVIDLALPGTGVRSLRPRRIA